jgi:hypothetical protein
VCEAGLNLNVGCWRAAGRIVCEKMPEGRAKDLEWNPAGAARSERAQLSGMCKGCVDESKAGAVVVVLAGRVVGCSRRSLLEKQAGWQVAVKELVGCREWGVVCEAGLNLGGAGRTLVGRLCPQHRGGIAGGALAIESWRGRLWATAVARRQGTEKGLQG